ncbi:hypothetical protein SAMD00019534_004120 [Acytostelium subglobosum LB1]|uniref:hypothetical protein n=1 Tax=Acytostelium subglobosum LB1 TaxID=1410327 RepID=UPI000644F2FE|nr:hypothetical protein SAMD00019534_004120 [Acytostelium subglobosum LB1]GAM17237.1 hypothetical protein SAMD00019534_004120 [Acytostelium subglobosum LB1]|eukprot:XP_012759299.1 hypothetical protein SAMD00019534_004120 [Acytostelium subglobosum LB1]
MDNTTTNGKDGVQPHPQMLQRQPSKKKFGNIFHMHSSSTPNLKLLVNQHQLQLHQQQQLQLQQQQSHTAPTSPTKDNDSSSSSTPGISSGSSTPGNTHQQQQHPMLLRRNSTRNDLISSAPSIPIRVSGENHGNNNNPATATSTPPTSPRSDDASPPSSSSTQSNGNNNKSKKKDTSRWSNAMRRVKTSNKLKKEIEELSMKTGLSQQYSTFDMYYETQRASPDTGLVDPSSSPNSQRKSRFIEATENSTEEYSNIPRAIKLSIEHLFERSLQVPGLFRESANAMELSRLKLLMESDRDVDLTNVGHHNIAGLVKQYFRDRPSPIFPYDLHKQIYDLYESGQPQQQISEQLKSLLKTELSKGQFLILRYLFELLHAIHLQSEVNMMNAYNLAVCFAPTLIRSFDCSCIDVVTKLIDDYELVFGENVLDVPTTTTPMQALEDSQGTEASATEDTPAAAAATTTSIVQAPNPDEESTKSDVALAVVEPASTCDNQDSVLSDPEYEAVDSMTMVKRKQRSNNRMARLSMFDQKKQSKDRGVAADGNVKQRPRRQKDRPVSWSPSKGMKETPEEQDATLLEQQRRFAVSASMSFEADDEMISDLTISKENTASLESSEAAVSTSMGTSIGSPDLDNGEHHTSGEEHEVLETMAPQQQEHLSTIAEDQTTQPEMSTPVISEDVEDSIDSLDITGIDMSKFEQMEESGDELVLRPVRSDHRDEQEDEEQVQLVEQVQPVEEDTPVDGSEQTVSSVDTPIILQTPVAHEPEPSEPTLEPVVPISVPIPAPIQPITPTVIPPVNSVEVTKDVPVSVVPTPVATVTVEAIKGNDTQTSPTEPKVVASSPHRNTIDSSRNPSPKKIIELMQSSNNKTSPVVVETPSKLNRSTSSSQLMYGHHQAPKQQTMVYHNVKNFSVPIQTSTSTSETNLMSTSSSSQRPKLSLSSRSTTSPSLPQFKPSSSSSSNSNSVTNISPHKQGSSSSFISKTSTPLSPPSSTSSTSSSSSSSFKSKITFSGLQASMKKTRLSAPGSSERVGSMPSSTYQSLINNIVHSEQHSNIVTSNHESVKNLKSIWENRKE